MQQDNTVRRIMAALEHDPDVNLHRYPIRVREEDGTIHLEGEVEHIAAKRRAFRLARKHAGSTPVIDQLRLKLAQPREDRQLTQTVVQALAGEPVFRNFTVQAGLSEQRGTDWIGVQARDGRVRLDGSANSLSHRRMAEVLSWWVPGCADVDNRIRVQPAEKDNDAEISDAIRLILDKDPSLDAQQIGVATRDREVYLTGAVPTEQARRTVTFDCWYIPGVHAVHNAVSVNGHSR